MTWLHIFSQKRHAMALNEQIYAKLFNITDYQGDAIQKYNEISPCIV
jgi:ribosomal protein S7